MLLEFIAAHPKDSFARFGAAMEYARLGDHAKALECFQALCEINPDYVAAYFQAGKLLAKIGDNDEARSVLGRGIEAAVRTKDLHAKAEMEGFLAEIALQ